MTAKAFQGINTRSRDNLRDDFIAQLHALAVDIRFLWLPKGTDGLTSIDESSRGAVITHSATLQGRLSALGLGYGVSFNGGHYASAPDVASYSFGAGGVDSSFSLVVVANVTDTGAGRTFIAKNTSLNQEWTFQVSSADKLFLALIDQASGAVQPSRLSDNPISQAAWGVFDATYNTATGSGATAATGISQYQNGVLLASTATNNGAYVSMVNGTGLLEIGGEFAHTGGLYVGSQAMSMLVGGALTAAQHWAIKKLISSYFRI